MTGGDKILSRIKSDCDKKILAIEAESDKVCADIIAKGKAEAEKAAAEINRRAQIKANQIKEASKSRSELEIRNALLKNRRKEIDDTIDLILEYMTQLDDKAYFELIYELAKTLGGANGEILLNQKDLSRLPDDFTQRLSESGVTAAVNKSAVDISGGFILKSGDIEENMSFESVIADKRDLLEDLINRELFVE